MVAKRAKTYVDYKVANNIYNDLKNGSWHKKLKHTKEKIESTKDLLNKIDYTARDNIKNVKYYGINPDYYGKEMKEEVNKLKDLQKTYKDNKEKYNAVLKKAEIALNTQKTFVDQEFNHLYADNKSKEFSYNEKYNAVEHFKNTGKLYDLQDISESYEEHNKRPSLTQQTQNISKSIFILNKAIQKEKRLREQGKNIKIMKMFLNQVKGLRSIQNKKRN